MRICEANVFARGEAIKLRSALKHCEPAMRPARNNFEQRLHPVMAAYFEKACREVKPVSEQLHVVLHSEQLYVRML